MLALPILSSESLLPLYSEQMVTHYVIATVSCYRLGMASVTHDEP